MVTFLVVLVICVLVHLMAIAATGAMLGVPIQVFSLGFGPTLYSRGKFRIGLIPSGGYVKFLDTNETEVSESEMHKAFDQQPLVKKLCICLSGCAAGAVVSFVFLGRRHGRK
jgi:membrane-associated protease RseP (regulator of RpoE activity)